MTEKIWIAIISLAVGLAVRFIYDLVVHVSKKIVRARDPNQFRIVFAEYGASPNLIRDVTTNLKGDKKSGKLKMRVDNNITKDPINPDPAPLITKRIVVYYMTNGQLKRSEVAEKKWLDLVQMREIDAPSSVSQE